MAEISVKICGLKRPDQVAAAAEAGARYIGFNFFPKSPRYVTPPAEAGGALMLDVPVGGVAKVALVVNAPDDQIARILDATTADMIQLHGAESPPERVAEVKARFGLPVIKALGIAEAADVAQIDLYAPPVADQLLIDAKAPPKGAVLPGGNGLAFDWTLWRANTGPARGFWRAV